MQFVVVKAGGLNVTPQYVAPHYHAQIDRAVAASLPKGHYYLIGRGQSPEAQAEFFAANLYRFDRDRDVLALDNESLDGNGTRWGDADAARFVRRVIALTGIPASRVWHYAGAADYRATGSWPELAALGIRFWWAAYGSYPTGHTPDHTPSLQGSIPRWDVHQYSSAVAVAGYALDGNFSPHSVGELFGGGTMEDQMRQYVAANKKPSGAATWDQMCGSLMFRFNSWRGWKSMPVRDISSAFRVSQGSTIVSTDRSSAPIGAFHFFDIGGPGNGHVMQDARGGGLVCLSTGYALSESLGYAIGFQSVSGYVAAKGARYIGWSRDYAGGTIDVSGVAGGAYRPIESASRKKDDMEFRVIKDSNPPVAVVYDSTTYTIIDSGTDKAEFDASESAHGAGMDRAYLTPEEWRIESIQIGKRAAAQAARIAAAITGVPTGGTSVPADLAPVIDAIGKVPAATVAAFVARQQPLIKP